MGPDHLRPGEPGPAPWLVIDSEGHLVARGMVPAELTLIGDASAGTRTM